MASKSKYINETGLAHLWSIIKAKMFSVETTAEKALKMAKAGL